MSVLIAPSMLSANFANLENDIQTVNKSDADLFHLDIMDGVFVPNISYYFMFVKISISNFQNLSTLAISSFSPGA
jgi:ribulose-phosphate 3-epimerase